jgi:hypothetical protein
MFTNTWYTNVPYIPNIYRCLPWVFVNGIKIPNSSVEKLPPAIFLSYLISFGQIVLHYPAKSFVHASSSSRRCMTIMGTSLKSTPHNKLLSTPFRLAAVSPLRVPALPPTPYPGS